MVDKIEMSLDDIIKSNRGQQRKVGVGQSRRGRGGVAANRGASSIGRRGSPRKTVGGGVIAVLKGRNFGGVIQKAKFARVKIENKQQIEGDVNSAWKHDMYEGPRRGGGILKSVTESAKLLVSNLDYGVSDSDIQELFAEFGPLKKAAVHYDRSGRSLGTADVLFERRADALKSIKQYNGVPLDGRPMSIALATSDVAALARPARGGASASIGRRISGGPPARRGGINGGGRLGMPNRNRTVGGANAAGRRVAVKSAPTAEELDAELDAYVNDMKI